MTSASFALLATLSLDLSLESSAHAAGPAEEAAAEDPALSEAKNLYKEGEIKFRMAEYLEALALWKRAFAILPEGDETRGIRP